MTPAGTSPGTSGVFGAAAAIGKLLGLSEQQMVWALGLAATQAAGLREMFGSMAKAFHPGRSAQNGYAAALLAQAGFTAGERGIEGAADSRRCTASRFDLSKITAGLGVDFDLRANTYKPFPCGIVNHPTIDACIQMHDAHRIPAADIASVQLRVAPLVLDLCNQTASPRTAGEVLRLSRRGGRARAGQGRHPGVHRRRRERSRRQARARAGARHRRRGDHRGPGAHRSCETR